MRVTIDVHTHEHGKAIDELSMSHLVRWAIDASMGAALRRLRESTPVSEPIINETIRCGSGHTIGAVTIQRDANA